MICSCMEYAIYEMNDIIYMIAPSCDPHDKIARYESSGCYNPSDNEIDTRGGGALSLILAQVVNLIPGLEVMLIIRGRDCGHVDVKVCMLSALMKFNNGVVV